MRFKLGNVIAGQPIARGQAGIHCPAGLNGKAAVDLLVREDQGFEICLCRCHVVQLISIETGAEVDIFLGASSEQSNRS